MAVGDLFKRAPGLVVLWIVAVMMLLLIALLYIIQRTQISKQGRVDLIRSLGNAIGGIGIGICVIGAVWIVLLVILLRDARNVWSDASSLYVSRDNLLLNWFVGDTIIPNSATAGGISGDPPGDHAVCNEKFGTSQPQDVAYAPYRELIKAYHGPNPIPQYYIPAPTVPPAPAAPAHIEVDDNLVNQQKLSLAYYRQMYCTKSYFQDILNGVGIDQMTFLTPLARENLIGKKSSCGHGKILDTQPCTDGSTSQLCAKNECFTALNQSIAAQCLFYDDHVSIHIDPTGGPKGTLSAFSIGVTNAPGGIEVKPPTAPA